MREKPSPEQGSSTTPEVYVETEQSPNFGESPQSTDMQLRVDAQQIDGSVTATHNPDHSDPSEDYLEQFWADRPVERERLARAAAAKVEREIQERTLQRLQERDMSWPSWATERLLVFLKLVDPATVPKRPRQNSRKSQ